MRLVDWTIPFQTFLCVSVIVLGAVYLIEWWVDLWRERYDRGEWLITLVERQYIRRIL